MTSSERIQVAQELHDGIAQDLVGVGYSLDLILSAPDTPITTRIQLRTLRFNITELIEKVRAEIFQLRQSESLKLSVHIKILVSELCEGYLVDLDLAENLTPLLPEVQYQLLKIVGELLRNTVEHSAASHVKLHIWEKNDSLFLSMSDDGVGGAQSVRSRYGILGIQERCTNLGAAFAMNSDSMGTSIIIQIPRHG